MGVFDGLLSGLGGGVLGALGAGINAFTQEDINRQNIAFQTQTNQQNEALLRESWGREDNAVQRRAADLKAAGMNPLLAAGGSAQSSGPVQLKAPSAGENPGWGNIASGALAGAVQGMNAAQTNAQIDLTAQQASKVAAEKQGVDLQNQFLSQTLGARAATTQSQSEEAAAQAKSAGLAAAFASDSYQSRLQEVLNQTGLTGQQWSNAVQQAVIIMNQGLASEYGVGQAESEAALAKMKLDYQAALTKAVGAGIDYTKAQTSALAYAAQASPMNADVLKKMGIPPIVLSALQDLFKVISFFTH